MRPGLGRSLRSLNPPRRLGGWGDPLGTISKWGRASSHDGDIRALMRPLERCCFFSAQMPAGLHRFMPRPGRSGESQSNVWATHCKTSRASSSRPSDN
jgi:hypothetical protein